MQRAGALLAVLLVASCGGAGDSGDINPNAPVAQALAPNDPNSFLLFPNPQVQPNGSLQTDSVVYAQAYYAAIDPTNAKDTLAKWKAANQFDSGTGTQVSVVFGDVRDLGYGRRMTVRQNTDGTVAAVVENFLVSAAVNYSYSSVNLDAAVLQDRRWHDGTNAIEFSPLVAPAPPVPPVPTFPPGPPVPAGSFAKFFNFDAATGNRGLTVDLDGRGDKAMPGPCITCHGGRGDPLTPTGLFPLLANSASLARGDVQAKMQPLEVDHLDFSSTPPYRRVDQEAALKAINQMVLCTYPRDPLVPAVPVDSCRRTAASNEWQGTAADLIKSAYGGPNLPNATYADTFVPPLWVGQQSLYANVVAPACRSCHLVRGSGTGPQSNIDFNTYVKFQGYAARTRAHVIDRGNMPLAKIVFQDFWASPARVEQLGAFLEAPPQNLSVRDSGGAVLRPGRPVADPGPDRTIAQGGSTLSAAGSLFASTYSWSVVSGPNGAIPPTNVSLTNPNAVQSTINAAADGTYVLQLVVGDGTTQSPPVQLRLFVNNALAPVPSSIRFADIKNVLQTVTPGTCTNCHGGTFAPMAFTSIDRDGSGGAADATDDLWFYTELRGRINFADLGASPLLRKPSGNHHGGGLGTNFNASLDPGQPGRANYDLFLNWILNGAPQ